MKVETVRRKVVDEKPEKDRVYGSQEEMLERRKQDILSETLNKIWYTVQQEKSYDRNA